MNAATIYSVIDRVQARLNLIIISTYTLKVMKFSAIAAGLLVMAAHLSGRLGVNLFYWLLLTLCGSIAGSVYGWCQRLKPTSVAHWIDEQLHSHEALTAALICLDRSCNNPWDKAIVERARLLASDAAVFKWPLQNLRRQAFICGGICLSTTVLLYFGLQINPMIRENDFSNLIQPKRTVTDRMNRNRAKSVLQTSPQAVREIAQALFPQNSEMARLAESALKSGDMNAIKSLMKKSEIEFEEKAMQNASIPQEQRQKQARENARARAQLMQALSHNGLSQRFEKTSETQNNGEAANSGRQSNSDKTKRFTKGQFLKRVKSANAITSNAITGMEEARRKAMNGRDAQSPQYENDNAKYPKTGKTTLSGRGLENNKRNWGEIKPNSNPPKAVIAKRKNSPVLEFVLPGKNSRIPVAQILPAKRREAEAAISRQGVPGEYQDYLRIYFVELSQKLKGEKPENGGPK